MSRNILFTTIPKSGTHLVLPVLDQLNVSKIRIMIRHTTTTQVRDFHKGKIAWGHMLPRPIILERSKHYLARIFLYRNFRDTLVSWNHWFQTEFFLGVPEYQWKQEHEEYRQSKDKLLWLIENVHPYFTEMMEWVDIADHVLFYDELMYDPACSAVRQLADNLGLDWKATAEILRRRYSPTYRRACPGAWVEHFEYQHTMAYYKHWGHLEALDRAFGL